MGLNIKGRDFLCLGDFDPDEIKELLDLSAMIKKIHGRGIKDIGYLKGKNIALLFQKPSTRTRVSFEVAINQLGGYPLYLSWRDLQLSRGETIRDTARVLDKYVDGIVARVYDHKHLKIMAENFGGPVINALSDLYHPCQILADLMTIKEHFGDLEGLTLAFLGDGYNNVTHSLIIGAAQVGMNIVVASPERFRPSSDVVRRAREIAKETGSNIDIIKDPESAVRDADIIYTDVFVSMGKEKEREERIKILWPYRVDKKLFMKAPEHAVFMHCGPWHLGEEVDPEVVYHERSLVFTQAENRLYTEKALLIALF